jgi:hypothetical protein
MQKAKLEETEMDWSFELDGEASGKLELRPLASACNCTIRPGPGGTPWLGGTKFDGMTSPEQALEDAKKTLARLNGLARLENPQHRTVSLGNAYCQDQRLHYIASSGPRIPKSEVYEYASPLTGGPFEPPVDPADDRRRTRIMADPKLAEILEVFAAEKMTWQRLRVAFEKIRGLVGKGNDDALVKHGYAARSELTCFKANVQDPRHSGVNAVHGVPQKYKLKGRKMTEMEGFVFVARLFNTYVEKQPS